MWILIPELTGSKWFETTQPSGNAMFPGPIGLFNPAGLLDQLGGQARQVTVDGQTAVDGARTTEYSASYDSKAVPVGPLTVEVWVDQSGLVRQVHMQINQSADGSATSATPDSSTAITVVYSNFGVKVHIQAPPADQVTTDPAPSNFPNCVPVTSPPSSADGGIQSSGFCVTPSPP